MKSILEDDRCHPLAEFGAIPWDRLDPDRAGKDWSIGRGGYGLGDGTWRLMTYEADGSCDVWELHPAVGAMLDMVKHVGKQGARREIRAAFAAFQDTMDD